METSTDWDGTPHWEKEPEVAERYIRYVDLAVESSMLPQLHHSKIQTDISEDFPQGVTSQDIIPHGVSFWTRTAQIVASQEDGSPVSFFLKVRPNF
jgi:phosphodiesterase/alkaline phosphatase D-like protein